MSPTKEKTFHKEQAQQAQHQQQQQQIQQHHNTGSDIASTPTHPPTQTQTQTQKNIGVIGSGIIGLSTALVLSERGGGRYRIGIVARDMPGIMGEDENENESLDWASPWAGAGIIPPLETAHKDLVTASFNHYYHFLATAAASSSSSSSSSSYSSGTYHNNGVQRVPATVYHDDLVPSDSQLWFRDLVPGFRVLPASELPPGIRSGYTFSTTTINPPVLLRWLRWRLTREFGVVFVRATVSSIDEARETLRGRMMSETTGHNNNNNIAVMINASGLGAKRLAGDDAVIGVRGQTIFLKGASAARFPRRTILRTGHEYTYVIPRRSRSAGGGGGGGVIMGGISQRGNYDRTVDPALREDILERVNRLTGDAFKDVVEEDGGRDRQETQRKDIVGIRPSREGGFRLERVGDVVHAYGFEGKGYCFSFGVAGRVLELVREALVAGERKITKL